MRASRISYSRIPPPYTVFWKIMCFHILDIAHDSISRYYLRDDICYVMNPIIQSI